MKNTIKSFFLFIIFWGHSKAYSQELIGYILDEFKKPIENAHIQLLREGVLRGETNTDKAGKFQIYPINKGGYMALIKVGGYNTLIQKIDINTDTINHLDFIFHKRKKKPTT